MRPDLAPVRSTGAPPSDAWILTISGVRFDLLQPTPDMVRIADIAHALSHVCRFAGHTRGLYTVAQHSLIVAANVPPAEALTALLHDATEAYVGDMTAPLKRHMPDYQAVEARLWQVIRERFDLGEITPAIKEADIRALYTERRDLLIPSPHAWPGDETRPAPFEERITPWAPPAAKRAFMQRFGFLTGVRP